MDERVIIYNSIMAGDYRQLRRILEQECSQDIVLKESSGLCGLTLATVNQKIAIVKTYIRYKASLNVKDKRGITAAMYACVYNNEEILSLLETAGADLTVLDNSGKSALHHAAQSGSLECLKSLLENEMVDLNLVDFEGKSAIMLAACGSNSACLEFLANYEGMDIDRVDKEGNSPLIAAIHRRKGDHARILLDVGAEVNLKNFKGKTALSKAFEQTMNVEMIEMVRRLLSHGAKPNFSSSDQLYLHEMIARGQKNIVQLMVINGCSPLLRQCKENAFQFNISEKISPLAVALLSNQLAIAKYLICNLFLTPFDILNLPNCQAITRHLTGAGHNQCWSLLKSMAQSPLPLFVLSFMAVAKLTFNKEYKYKSHSQQKILSQLPTIIENKLLCRTPVARLCIKEWETIPLMFESGHVFSVTQPLYSMWPMGHKLTECRSRCCSNLRNYRLLRMTSNNEDSLDLEE